MATERRSVSKTVISMVVAIVAGFIINGVTWIYAAGKFEEKINATEKNSEKNTDKLYDFTRSIEKNTVNIENLTKSQSHVVDVIDEMNSKLTEIQVKIGE